MQLTLNPAPCLVDRTLHTSSFILKTGLTAKGFVYTGLGSGKQVKGFTGLVAFKA